MTDVYTFVPERSRFTVQAFAAGMLSGFAHSPVFAIRCFGGEISFAPDGVSSCQITVEAGSLELTGNVKEKDRQEIHRATFEEVLEVGKYPNIEFRSTEFALVKIADNWFRAQISGEMRLQGMAHPQRIDAQLRVTEDELRLSGTFPLLLSTYKLKRVSALGGMIQVKDELKFDFDLVARKREVAK